MSEPTDPTDPASYSGFADPSNGSPAPAEPTATEPTWTPSLDPTPVAPMPTPMSGGAGPAPMLISFGDVAVTQFQVITPSGSYPLQGTTWFVTDHTTYTQATPTYAVILAVVLFFAFCALSLLFLLIKETRADGFVQVTVQGPGWQHVTQLPAGTAATANHQVAYVRNLVASLG